MNRTRDPEGWVNPNVRRFDRVGMTHPTRTAHARFTLASALVRLAFRVCPFSFVARFVEETVELAEEQDGFDGEPCEDCGGWTCQGHFWTQDGTQFRSYQ